MPDTFSLERLEMLVARRAYEEAALELTRLLDQMNIEHGGLSGMRLDTAVVARIAAAISSLFADPSFRFSDLGYRRLSTHHRWVNAIFGGSVFRTSDHILRSFNLRRDGPGSDIEISTSDLHKFCLLYSLDSGVPLNVEALWGMDKRLAATLFFALLSARIVISDAAHQKREILLEWLPARVRDIGLDDIPPAYLHDVWMHCSYAATPRKHEIKRAINRLIRDWARSCGLLAQEPAPATRPVAERPTLLLVLDWYHPQHAVFRVFSRVLSTLRSRFRVVGLGLHNDLDTPEVRETFDAVLSSGKELGAVQDTMTAILGEVARHKPDVTLFVGVGMSAIGMFLANVRMAPVQIASHGHPSSTFSEAIDYFLLEDCYADLGADFSEKLLTVPTANWPQLAPPVPALPPPQPPTGRLNIVLVLSLMKLNPVFLRACRAILDGCGVPATLHVMVGGTKSIAAVYVESLVRDFVPDAMVYPQLDPAAYVRNISACDMYLEPFPFGNSNSAVDCLMLGVPGVHMRGPQIFGRMGSVILDRCNVDPRLVANSVDEYVALGCELARNTAWRQELRATLLQTMSAGKIGTLPLFNGDPGPFADVVLRAARGEA